MGGTIGGAFQYESSRAEGNFAEFQANTNARFAELESQQVLEAGKRDAQQFGKMVKQAVGEQRVGFAAAGIDVSAGGTVAEVRADTEIIGRLDQLTIKNNAWKEAWGLRAEAMQTRFQGRYDKMSARNRGRGALISGFASDAEKAAKMG